VDGLLRHMDEAGVSHGVVLCIATNPKQQKSVNDFAASIPNERLTAFGSVHPFAPDAMEELDRLHALGIRGIKLHPQYQGFAVDDERVFPLYAKMAALGMPVVFHAGVDIGFPAPYLCEPEALARALPAFSGSAVVAAHMGGYMRWDEVEKHLVGQPVYLDTAYCYSRIATLPAKRMIENHGPQNVLFGSDCPWARMEDEIRFVRSLGLEPWAEEAILGKNAERLLGLA